MFTRPGIWFTIDAGGNFFSIQEKSLVSTPWRYSSSKRKEANEGDVAEGSSDDSNAVVKVSRVVGISVRRVMVGPGQEFGTGYTTQALSERQR